MVFQSSSKVAFFNWYARRYVVAWFYVLLNKSYYISRRLSFSILAVFFSGCGGTARRAATATKEHRDEPSA